MEVPKSLATTFHRHLTWKRTTRSRVVSVRFAARISKERPNWGTIAIWFTPSITSSMNLGAAVEAKSPQGKVSRWSYLRSASIRWRERLWPETIAIVLAWRQMASLMVKGSNPSSRAKTESSSSPGSTLSYNWRVSTWVIVHWRCKPQNRQYRSLCCHTEVLARRNRAYHLRQRCAFQRRN